MFYQSKWQRLKSICWGKHRTGTPRHCLFASAEVLWRCHRTKGRPKLQRCYKALFYEPRPQRIPNHQNENSLWLLPQFIQEQQSQTPTAIAPVVPIETGRTRRPQHYIFIQSTNSIHKQKHHTPMETEIILFICLLLIATELVYRNPILKYYVHSIWFIWKRIKTAVNSAYSHHTQEHKSLNQSKRQRIKRKHSLKNKCLLCPMQCLHNTRVLKHITQVATTKEERDIFVVRFIGYVKCGIS